MVILEINIFLYNNKTIELTFGYIYLHVIISDTLYRFSKYHIFLERKLLKLSIINI